MTKRSLIFGRSAVVGCVGILAIGLLCGWGFVLRGAVDREGFRKLIVAVDPTQTEPAPHTSHHLRTEVHKEVILSKDFSGRRAHLFGKEAVIVLDRHRTGTDILEHLHSVQGSVKEEEEEYRLEADSLCCDYQQDQFSANQARISKWLRSDSAAPVFRANAPLAQLHLRSDTIELSGGVILESQGGKAFADQVTMVPRRIVMQDHVAFEDSVGKVEADHCTIDLEERSRAMERILLEGNIRLQNRLSTSLQYALADRADYDPKSGEMLLYSNDHGRVLFFDQGEDYQMSAKALRILRKKGMPGNTVQGLGDVRFHFADHEKEKITKRFGL